MTPALNVPPFDTVAEPPLLIVSLRAVPPLETMRMPPPTYLLPLSTPQTVSVPPLLTTPRLRWWRSAIVRIEIRLGGHRNVTTRDIGVARLTILAIRRPPPGSLQGSAPAPTESRSRRILDDHSHTLSEAILQ